MDNQPQEQPKQNFKIDEQQAGFMMGAVIGALAGGAAALLLSPKNGKEMREIVKRYSKELEREAQELARDAHGTATSFKSVLQEGATEVLEQAPEKIEQAGYQAQQLADELSHRFDSARDVVAELAEAFRSGWEEYGEEQPVDELTATPSLIADDEHEEITPKHNEKEKEAKVEIGELDAEDETDSGKDNYPAPLQARRRSHAGSAYSMHTAPKSDEEVEEVKPPVQREVEHKPETPKAEVKADDPQPPAVKRSGYTTRVIEEPRKIEVEKPKSHVEESALKKVDEKPAKKKLLFRRGK